MEKDIFILALCNQNLSVLDDSPLYPCSNLSSLTVSIGDNGLTLNELYSVQQANDNTDSILHLVA